MAQPIVNLLSGITSSVVNIGSITFKPIADLVKLHSLTSLYDYSDFITNYTPTKAIRTTLRKFDISISQVANADGSLDIQKIQTLISSQRAIILENKVAIIYLRIRSRVGKFAILDLNQLKSKLNATDQVKNK